MHFSNMVHWGIYGQIVVVSASTEKRKEKGKRKMGKRTARILAVGLAAICFAGCGVQQKTIVEKPATSAEVAAQLSDSKAVSAESTESILSESNASSVSTTSSEQEEESMAIPADYLDANEDWHSVLATMAYCDNVRDQEMTPSYNDADNFWYHIGIYMNISSSQGGKNYIDADGIHYIISEDEVSQLAYAMFPDFDGKIPDPSMQYQVSKNGNMYSIVAGSLGAQPDRQLASFGSGNDTATMVLTSTPKMQSIPGITRVYKTTFQLTRNPHMDPMCTIGTFYYVVKSMKTEDATNYAAKSADLKAFQEVVADNYSDHTRCALWDIDNDGQPELLIDIHPNEADATLSVYTYNGKTAQPVPISTEDAPDQTQNQIGYGKCGEMRPFDGGVAYAGGSQGVYFVRSLTWQNGKLLSKEVSNLEIDPFANTAEQTANAANQMVVAAFAKLNCGETINWMTAEEFLKKED